MLGESRAVRAGQRPVLRPPAVLSHHCCSPVSRLPGRRGPSVSSTLRHLEHSHSDLSSQVTRSCVSCPERWPFGRRGWAGVRGLTDLRCVCWMVPLGPWRVLLCVDFVMLRGKQCHCVARAFFLLSMTGLVRPASGSPRCSFTALSRSDVLRVSQPQQGWCWGLQQVPPGAELLAGGRQCGREQSCPQLRTAALGSGSL